MKFDFWKKFQRTKHETKTVTFKEAWRMNLQWWTIRGVIMASKIYRGWEEWWWVGFQFVEYLLSLGVGTGWTERGERATSWTDLFAHIYKVADRCLLVYHPFQYFHNICCLEIAKYDSTDATDFLVPSLTLMYSTHVCRPYSHMNDHSETLTFLMYV